MNSQGRENRSNDCSLIHSKVLTSFSEFLLFSCLLLVHYHSHSNSDFSESIRICNMCTIVYICWLIQTNEKYSQFGASANWLRFVVLL